MTDTIKASVITDHAFEPRMRTYWTAAEPLMESARKLGAVDRLMVQPNPHLCQRCRMAEAAHRETTVKRKAVVHPSHACPCGSGLHESDCGCGL